MRTMRWIRAGMVAAAIVAGGAALADSAAGDQSFLTQALATNRLELALGRLAIDRAVTPAVQAMGKKMVQKHTEIGQQLGERAVALSVTLPAETSAADKATFARLAALSGADFDAAFEATVDGIHRRELALYEAEARSTARPELRALVAGRVVSLRKSLGETAPAKQEQDW
jgi:putative membrane protein